MKLSYSSDHHQTIEQIYLQKSVHSHHSRLYAALLAQTQYKFDHLRLLNLGRSYLLTTYSAAQTGHSLDLAETSRKMLSH